MVVHFWNCSSRLEPRKDESCSEGDAIKPAGYEAEECELKGALQQHIMRTVNISFVFFLV